MRSVLRVLTSGLLLALFCAAAFAQGSQTGGITGVVTDPQGAVVPGATIDVISEATGKPERRVTTGDDGSYTVSLLPPGTYKLEVTAKNFKKTVVTDAAVRITETTRQDVTLTVGGVTETVEVQATETLVNAASPVTGQGVNAQTIERLPLANPNVLFLLSLSAGTLSEPTDVRTAGRGSVDVNVNGGRTSNNSITLEGVNVNDFNLAHFDTVPLPNPNVLQEFKVATSLYDATQGSKGGGALGLVIKTGSKDFHTDLYWMHRNDALNANDFFFNRDGKKRPKFLQNVFGGTASGPVPGAGGFWFFNYQGVRARNGVDPNGSTTNPIVQNFATAPDGTTSAALLAAQFNLTPAQIDPVAVKILNLQDARYGGTYLVPRRGQTACGTTLNGLTATDPGNFTCQFAAVAPVTDNQYTISYDRFWRGGNEKLTGRWFYDNGSIAKPYGTDTSLTFPRTDIQKNRFLSLNYTHIFSPSLISELRAGYSRYIAAQSPIDPVSLADIGAVRGNSSEFPGMYRVSVTGLFSIGTGVNDDRATTSNQYNMVETVSWIRGKHSMRLGGEGVQYQLNRFNNFSVRGSLTFGGTGTQASAFTNCKNDTNDCTAFQNFLRGRITAIQSAFGDPARNFIATDYAGFFQDDYKWSQRLTFNLGVRWEGMSFGRDKLYRAGIYDPALAAAGKNPFLFPEKVDLAGFKGTPGVPDCALKDCFDGNNWAPRVGLAWDIGGNQKTVMRAGYGLYYQRLSNQNILQNSLAAPFTVQPLDNRANPTALQLANPLASIPPPSIVATAYIPSATFFAGLRRTSGSGPLDPNDPNVAPIFVNAAGERCLNYGGTATNCSINLASFTSAPLDAYTPYTQQWNITLQRELGRGWATEIGYVGTHYIGGLGIWDPYQAKVVSASSPLTVHDINGNSYTITNNTVNNEELRHQIIGLSRKRGARYSGNIGQSKFGSLQLTALRRFQRGLYFQAAYTYSRTTDNVSGSLSTDELNATRNGQNGANIYNDQSNPQQNYARGDFDRPHRLIVSYSYDIPVPHDGFFDNQFFKGWSVSGITTYQKGLPFSVTDSTSGGIFGTTAGTAQFTCGSIESAYTTGTTEQRLAHYLNPACFTTAPIIPAAGFAANPGATGFGNTPRNAFRGPRQSNWDLSLIKHFHIGERHQFQFRSDFFNLFNHPVFRFPSVVNIGTPSTFTLINSTAVPPRLIQFGLKYSF
ncbi:MAG: TonB-dependent receptor domain-containing protein [Pyrinomonadaceae bacterium]